MKWFEQFAQFLAKHGRYKVVYNYRDRHEVTMYRYYIIRPTKWWPFGICLHEILHSDPKDFHDHAFPYISMILKGGYIEHTPNEVYVRGLNSWAFHSASWMHRLEIPKGVDSSWTLFFMLGPKWRESGFLNENGKWESWQTFLGQFAQ